MNVNKIIESFRITLKVPKAMTEAQKNKLRIKYLKEGIKLLEMGIAPPYYWVFTYNEFKFNLFLSELGADILYCNGFPHQERLMVHNRFKYNTMDDLCDMLHNWKRFLELVEKR